MPMIYCISLIMQNPKKVPRGLRAGVDKLKTAIAKYPGSFSPERRRARKAARQKVGFFKKSNKLLAEFRREIAELKRSMISFSGKPPVFSKNKKVRGLQSTLASLQSQWRKLIQTGASKSRTGKIEQQMQRIASELKQENDRLRFRLKMLPKQIAFLEEAIRRAEQMEPEALFSQSPIGDFERFMSTPLTETIKQWSEGRKKGK